MSMLHTVTIGFPGSFIVDVVGLTSFQILPRCHFCSHLSTSRPVESPLALLCLHLSSGSQNFAYVRLDNLGLVEITLSGALGFWPKCASKGEIFVVFCLHIRNW